MLIEQRGPRPLSLCRADFSPRTGGFVSAAPGRSQVRTQGRCCADNSRTDRHAGCPPAAHLREWRDPPQSAGALLGENQRLALQSQRRSPASCGGIGEFRPSGPHRHRHRPPVPEAAAAPQRDAVAREPSRSANGAVPPRPSWRQVSASCSGSATLAQTPCAVQQGTAHQQVPGAVRGQQGHDQGPRPSLSFPPGPNPAAGQ